MTIIKHKPLSEYYTDTDKAVINRIGELASARRRFREELAAINAAPESGEDEQLDRKARVDGLISGNVSEAPRSRSEKRNDLHHALRDIDSETDELLLQFRNIKFRAELKLAADIKPQVDVLEKTLVDAGVALHNAHLNYWSNKRALLNAGIGIHTNFLSNIDDVIGIPVNDSTKLAQFFREAIKNGHLKKMPADFQA